MKKWKSCVFWIVLCEAVGVVSGLLTRESSRLFRIAVLKPPLTPLGVVFPIVWAILFALMGIGAARIGQAPPSGRRVRSLIVFCT